MTINFEMYITKLKSSSCIREVENGITLDFEIIPGSVELGIKGYNPWRDRIIVKICARAQKGAANIELIDFLSKLFLINKIDISIIKGEHSFQKTIKIIGLKRNNAIRYITGVKNE